MADMLGGGIGDGFPLEQWFWEMPPITRWWTTSTVICSVLVQCHVISPFNLFYSIRAVMKGQYWRLFSSFIYLGPINIDLIFHIFFLQRYARLTEEASGRSPARFAYLLTFASILLLGMAPFFSLPFLAQPLSSVLVYIWSRRNPDTLMSFMGLLVFKAPWLPWVLMGFSFALHGSVPKDEICGVIIGHIWYYSNDIYPPTHDGHRPFDPPQWWVNLFEAPQIEDVPDTGVANVEDDMAAGGQPEMR